MGLLRTMYIVFVCFVVFAGITALTNNPIVGALFMWGTLKGINRPKYNN
jgi:hypothetical protein